MSRIPLEITVNGENYSLAVEPNRTLLELLRTISTSRAPRKVVGKEYAGPAPSCGTETR